MLTDLQGHSYIKPF